MSDDFDIPDDIIDEIKKFFKFGPDLFDTDIFFFPESDKDLNFNKKNVKGFKISYHYETGMDDPEIKIEGDIDEKDIPNFLKNFNQNPKFMNLISAVPKGEIDASELSIESGKQDLKARVMEPYTEISDFERFSEIILEVPGIEKKDIIISFDEGGRKLTFSAKSKNRNYLKRISLPFKSSIDDYALDVNNGIATLKVKRG